MHKALSLTQNASTNVEHCVQSHAMIPKNFTEAQGELLDNSHRRTHLLRNNTNDDIIYTLWAQKFSCA